MHPHPRFRIDRKACHRGSAIGQTPWCAMEVTAEGSPRFERAAQALEGHRNGLSNAFVRVPEAPRPALICHTQPFHV